MIELFGGVCAELTEVFGVSEKAIRVVKLIRVVETDDTRLFSFYYVRQQNNKIPNFSLFV